jgi:hypothetical protein
VYCIGILRCAQDDSKNKHTAGPSTSRCAQDDNFDESGSEICSFQTAAGFPKNIRQQLFLSDAGYPFPVYEASKGLWVRALAPPGLYGGLYEIAE